MPDNDPFEQDPSRILAGERARLLKQIADLQAEHDSIIESSEDVALDDEHDPDGSTVAYERAKTAAMLARNEAQLVELSVAEERLAAGTYGSCETCGKVIPIERLQVLPLARSCAACPRPQG